MVNEDASQDSHESNDSGVSQITDVVLEQVTGLPAPLQKTFWKVLGRLATSAVDIPAAYFEGKAAEIRAATEGKVQVIRASSKSIAQQIEVPQPYLDAANVKFAARIVGKQKNLDAIARGALNELSQLPSPREYVGHHDASGEVQDDWLNAFEVEAENMSSDYMRNVFSKLLAGEVRKPGSFSRRAVKILGQMERQEAEIFARFCSLSVQFVKDGQIFSGLLLTLGENAAMNGLKKYGLDYRSLMTLIEYGLVLANLDGYQQLEMTGPGDEVTFFHGGNYYRYVSEAQGAQLVDLHGITTTRVGTELMQLVTPIPDPQYTAKLEEFLQSRSLRLDRGG